MSVSPLPYLRPKPVGDDPQLTWAAQVHSALQQLTPLQSQALTLIYHEGLSQAQVAHRLQTTPDSVKLAVGAAFRRLSGLLAS